MHDLLTVSDSGLYCPAGDFHIDPWRPVPRAVITHAHSDHARSGCGRYLCWTTGKLVLRERIGNRPIDVLRRGESVSMNGVKVSMAPAGHILGSAQVRLEHGGITWVVTGDYKLQADPTCEPFEPLRCDVLVTESTFGLPIYRWGDPAAVAESINEWWRENRDQGRTSVLFAYSLGKAQRLASVLDPAIGPIYAHGAVMRLVKAYRDSGIRLPSIDQCTRETRKAGDGRAMVIAPPSAAGGRWLRTFGDARAAMASGWMAIRGVRRRRGFDRGFVLSDHADFPGLLTAIQASGARRVLVTHGSAAALARLLCERGLEASVLQTRFTGETVEAETSEDVEAETSDEERGEESGGDPGDAAGDAEPVEVA